LVKKPTPIRAAENAAQCCNTDAAGVKRAIASRIVAYKGQIAEIAEIAGSNGPPIQRAANPTDWGRLRWDSAASHLPAGD